MRHNRSRNSSSLRRALAARLGAAAAGVTLIALPLLVAGPAGAQARTTASARVSAAAAGQPSDLNTAPTLGGWNVSADGNVVDIVADNTTGLAGIHPLDEADFPEAQTQFQSGPFGSALAAVFWPGAAGGNFGSLSTELGLPSQFAPIAAMLNDPIKASAQYPAGPATAAYPPGAPAGSLIMKSTAAPGGVTAEGAIEDQTAAGILDFSQAKGTSSSTATDTAVAQASSVLGGVSLLGGMIDIGGITSTAQATSDGNTGSGSAVTHVTDVTVLGQKASIGSDGLILPNFPSALGPITGPLIQNAVSQVISALGIKITEFPATESANGAGYTATSGGVSIEINPPSSLAQILEQAASVLAPLFPPQAAIIPTLPGLLQGLDLTITLGRATATSNASPPFDAGLGDLGGIAPAAPLPTGTQMATIGGTPALGGVSTAAAPSLSSTPSGSSVAPSKPTSPSVSLISLSQPLGAGAIALGVIVTLFAGAGLWRMGRMLLPADTAPVCPLGQDQS